MISGFVIYFSLSKGIKEYIVGRFVRLFPLFWVCATITFLVTIIYHTNISFKHYLIGLLMFNSGHMENMIDGSYWTLTFELLFYLYIGVFVWLFSKKNLEWFFISWLLISFFSFYLHLDQVFFFKLLSVRFAPYFIFGGMLALIVDTWESSAIWRKVVYSSTLFIAWLMPIYVSGKLQDQKETITNFTGSFDHGELVIVEALFPVMFLGVFLSLFPFAKNKTFSKTVFMLGGITYPLYLLHWKIGNTIISHSGHAYGTVTVFSIVVAVFIFITAILLSHYDFILRKKIKEKLDKTTVSH
jgi:peptidoglycan/LPS O-acetylase OafA/YrhL